jgi:hypothetical protein
MVIDVVTITIVLGVTLVALEAEKAALVVCCAGILWTALFW